MGRERNTAAIPGLPVLETALGTVKILWRLQAPSVETARLQETRAVR